MTLILLLCIALLAANAPWFSDRLFFIGPMKAHKGEEQVAQYAKKPWAWCLLELVVLYGVVGAIGFYAESSTMGQIEPKKWEFYAITSCLFLVFSFPGFVYYFLWRK